jgi:anhydro-N-acetylmuramic acid kinase
MAKERIFIGLYSGWSADGIDAAMAAVSGKGEKIKVHQLHQSHQAMGEDLRRRILEMSCDKTLPMPALVQLNHDVSIAFAEAAHVLIKQSAVKAEDIVAIGSSGQIACRLPRDGKDKSGLGGVLELGGASIIASRNRVAVASQFAQTDAAAGGQGGPVTAWADWVLFHDQSLSRAIVDLGGITSLSFVGSDCLPMDVVAFDVGPGAALIDALTAETYGRPMDADGAFAAAGKVHPALLNELLANPYFHRTGPKLTERQQWGAVYVARLRMIAERHRCREEDMVATVTEMIARTVAAAVGTLTERPHEIILTGGGAKNIFLAARIRALGCPSSTINSERMGLGVRAKQAVCMAVLAAARVDNTPIYCPFATGAKSPTILGSLVACPLAETPKTASSPSEETRH